VDNAEVRKKVELLKELMRRKPRRENIFKASWVFPLLNQDKLKNTLEKNNLQRG